MKTSKYLEELNTQSAADLKMQLVEAKKELFNLRFQNATKKLERILPESRPLLLRKKKLLNNFKRIIPA